MLCFSCPDSRSSLVAFLIHHVRLAAVPLHSACLPTASQILISDAWHTLLPHCPLTGELIFACTAVKRLDFSWNNCFLLRVLSIQGTRCARTREGTFPGVLGVCYASEIRIPPDVCGMSPPPTPANGPAQYCGPFHSERFPPRCVTCALTVDSPLLPSLISAWRAGQQRLKQINSVLHPSAWKIVLSGF